MNRFARLTGVAGANHNKQGAHRFAIPGYAFCQYCVRLL